MRQRLTVLVKLLDCTSIWSIPLQMYSLVNKLFATVYRTVFFFFFLIKLKHKVEGYNVYELYIRALLGSAAHFC